jgi:ADP-ribose pyrophosphatase YjhB (NUDIX family)
MKEGTNMGNLALILVGAALCGVAGWKFHEKAWRSLPLQFVVMLSFLIFACIVKAEVFPLAAALFAASAGLIVGTFAGNRFNRVVLNGSQYRFCPSCATPLTERDFEGHAKLACPSCDFVYWNNPITVAVALIPSADGKSIALVLRGVEPKAGFWCLPGGFGEPFEHPLHTARREAGEEAKVDVEVVRLLAVEKAPDRNQVLVFYLCKPTSQPLTPGSDAREAKYFPLDQLPEIAFITHRNVIERWRAEVNAAS